MLIFSVLILIFTVLFVLGLFTPSKALFWYKGNRTRGASCVIYLILFVITLAASSILDPDGNNSTLYKVTHAQQIKKESPDFIVEAKETKPKEKKSIELFYPVPPKAIQTNASKLWTIYYNNGAEKKYAEKELPGKNLIVYTDIDFILKDGNDYYGVDEHSRHGHKWSLFFKLNKEDFDRVYKVFDNRGNNTVRAYILGKFGPVVENNQGLYISDCKVLRVNTKMEPSLLKEVPEWRK